jgi:hypothetical protein
MASATLEEVQRLADQLSTPDQARLLEYLAPRIARAVEKAETRDSAASDAYSEAWQRFFRIGDEIARTTPPGAESMTAAVSKMRR